MSRKKLAKILLSVLVVVSTLVSVVVDWNSSHVFNPDWHPHGRFHDVMLLTLLIGLVPLLLWLLWRSSSEPEVAIKVTTAILVIFWGSFYVNLLGFFLCQSFDPRNYSRCKFRRISPKFIRHTDVSQYGGCSHHYYLGINRLLAISQQ